MSITSFSDLLAVARQQSEPQRLLFIFAKAVLPKDADAEQVKRFQQGQGGALEPLMCVDKTLDELTGFKDLVAESEQMGQDWHVVFVACLEGRGGIMPSSKDADKPLKMMTQTIQNGGDLTRFLAFDKNGEPVAFF